MAVYSIVISAGMFVGYLLLPLSLIPMVDLVC